MNTDASWRNGWRFRGAFEKEVGSVFSRFRITYISMRVVAKMTRKCSLFRVARDQIMHGFQRKYKHVTQFWKTYPEAFFHHIHHSPPFGHAPRRLNLIYIFKTGFTPTLSYHLRWRFPSNFFRRSFPTKTCMCSLFSHTRCVDHESLSVWSRHPQITS